MQKPATSRSDPASRRAYSRWHYQQNKDAYKARSAAARDAHRQKVRDHILKHLQENPCVDCGEGDPIVLEFDHRRDKEFNIANAVNLGVGVKRLEDEIAKCDVRCANCHRRKTYREQGLGHKG